MCWDKRVIDSHLLRDENGGRPTCTQDVAGARLNATQSFIPVDSFAHPRYWFVARFTNFAHCRRFESCCALGFWYRRYFETCSHRGRTSGCGRTTSPEFPDFEADNTCVKLDGNGSHFELTDPGANSEFDFTNGDAITLEAWIQVDKLTAGDNGYIVCKGRTGEPGFKSDNQNWALRMREVDGRACLNFLFASGQSKWHRWTSSSGFKPGTGWHHVAVTYRFGEPESIQGWIDGELQEGEWDMNGPTTAPPVVDDDSIWIGSAMKGASGSSFRGLIDEVSIHRNVLSKETLKRRFRREGPPRGDDAKVAKIGKPLPEVVPELPSVPPGQVLMTFHENLVAHDRWLREGEVIAPATVVMETKEFFMNRLPRKYDDWGVRDSWSAPLLMRVVADVEFPAGEREFLVRARGLGRLWFEDEVVLRTKAHHGSTDGHEAVDPIPPPPAPGLKPVCFGDEEVIASVKVPTTGTYRLILEVIVGGKKYRAEPGEMLVASRAKGEGLFEIITTDPSLGAHSGSMTEAGLQQAGKRLSSILQQVDDQNRRAHSAQQDEFWNRRHEIARDWAKQQLVASPQVNQEAKQSANPIDQFIAEKIAVAKKNAKGNAFEDARRFHDEVLPILRDNCFRCHGEKEKGGLRLNTLAAITKPADSGVPAVNPGHPETSELMSRIRETDEEVRMPPAGPLKPEQVALLEQWIKQGANWPAPPVTEEQVHQPSLVEDLAFLRRVALDTIGVPPSAKEIDAFLQDTRSNKRELQIKAYLTDERYADHWVSYWQDVLAENPNMLKPSLNNSGPFRYFLYEALRDNDAMDRWVTELVMLRGSEREGGSAGFGLAADNDAPMAAKGHIIAGAFLGIELQCARCHDSPYHSTKQKDLYSLAAMLARKEVTVPKTSTVAPGFFEKKTRESLIKVTLQPGEPIAPEWPFEQTTGKLESQTLDALMTQPKDSRERLAALITAPQNERFAKVVVNRVWKQLIGIGIVEPLQDWEGRQASHPELLQWLAHDFIAHDYDLKHLMFTIMSSDLYQREALSQDSATPADLQFFVAPQRRRMSAEQVVDSLYSASGHEMNVEELTFDPEARRPAETMITLGRPSRAWMFATLSNERDRPSLALPRAQAVTDVLEAFGWNGSRQSPVHEREEAPSVLQPGVLANSVLASWVSRASVDSQLAEVAVAAKTPQELVDTIFAKFLTRKATEQERQFYGDALAVGFAERVLPVEERTSVEKRPPLGTVTWSNHLHPQANEIQLEMEKRAREGEPADPRLRSQWREVYEDFVWAVINTPEFVWVP